MTNVNRCVHIINNKRPTQKIDANKNTEANSKTPTTNCIMWKCPIHGVIYAFGSSMACQVNNQ